VETGKVLQKAAVSLRPEEGGDTALEAGAKLKSRTSQKEGDEEDCDEKYNPKKTKGEPCYPQTHVTYAVCPKKKKLHRGKELSVVFRILYSLWARG